MYLLLSLIVINSWVCRPHFAGRVNGNVGADFKTSGAMFVSPEDYGAKGDGVTDDTFAFQQMFNQAIIRKVKIIIPSKTYYITKTINVMPPLKKTEFRLDVDANGENTLIYSGNKGACLRIVGMRFSNWRGLKIKLQAAAGIVGIDLDTDATSHSTSNNTFLGCHISLGKGAGQRGWRMGLTPGKGGDISIISWNNCSVYGNYGRVITGQTGWHNQGANCLNNTLNTCFGAYLDKLFSNTSTESKSTGNGAFYFYGLGTSHNNLEFEISNAQTYIISGGRFELGKHVLHVTNSNVAPSITFRGVEISNYDPAESEGLTNGCLFFLDMPCYLKLDGCNIGNAQPYNERMIRAFGGGGGKTIGTLIVDGGSICADKDRFYQVNLNKTRWAVYVRGVGWLKAGVRLGQMTDRAGVVPLNFNR